MSAAPPTSPSSADLLHELKPPYALEIGLVGNRIWGGTPGHPLEHEVKHACREVWQATVDSMTAIFESHIVVPTLAPTEDPHQRNFRTFFQHQHPSPRLEQLHYRSVAEFFRGGGYAHQLSIQTALARGVDQLGAQAALELNEQLQQQRSLVRIALQSVMPFAGPYYPASGANSARPEFDANDSATLHDLAGKARQIVRLDGRHHCSGWQEDTRLDGYRHGISMMLDDCDLLVAVFDPTSTPKPAGTCETVLRALESGMSVLGVLISMDAATQQVSKRFALWETRLEFLRDRDASTTQPFDRLGESTAWRELLHDKLAYLLTPSHSQPTREELALLNQWSAADLQAAIALNHDDRAFVKRLFEFYGTPQRQTLLKELLKNVLPPVEPKPSTNELKQVRLLHYNRISSLDNALWHLDLFFGKTKLPECLQPEGREHRISAYLWDVIRCGCAWWQAHWSPYDPEVPRPRSGLGASLRRFTARLCLCRYAKPAPKAPHSLWQALLGIASCCHHKVHGFVAHGEPEPAPPTAPTEITLEPFKRLHQRGEALSLSYMNEYRWAFPYAYLLAGIAVLMAVSALLLSCLHPKQEYEGAPPHHTQSECAETGLPTAQQEHAPLTHAQQRMPETSPCPKPKEAGSELWFYCLSFALGLTKILIVLALIRVELRHRGEAWQEHAVEFRYLCELVRPMQWLAALGTSVPRTGMPEFYRPFDSKLGWEFWLFRACMRQQPVVLCAQGVRAPQTVQLDKHWLLPALKACRDGWLQDQRGYHWRNAVKMHRLENGIEAMAERLLKIVFVCACVACSIEGAPLILHLAGEKEMPSTLEHLEHLALLLTGFAAVLPAFIAALNGIRSQAEAPRLELRSESMLHALNDRHRLLNDLITEVESIPDANADQANIAYRAAQTMRSLAGMMVEEASEWKALYQMHEVKAG